jgi:hypothetical protein
MIDFKCPDAFQILIKELIGKNDRQRSGKYNALKHLIDEIIKKIDEITIASIEQSRTAEEQEQTELAAYRRDLLHVKNILFRNKQDITSDNEEKKKCKKRIIGLLDILYE